MPDGHLTGMPMAITAENLAEQYDISRAACDEYALRSQHARGQAQKNGYFDAEIAPVELVSRRGTKFLTPMSILGLMRASSR